MSSPEPPARQGARTTHRRGRMTPTRVATLEDLGPRFGVSTTELASADALDEVFGRRASRLLDVGVGNGDATLDRARRHPEEDTVAVELHRPGIAYLLRKLDDDGITSMRIVEADVTALIDAVGHGVFDEVRILFPDPWPKARHHKRRLVEPGFVRTVVDRLPVGGRLHLATDWLDYADWMRAAIAADDRLAPQVDQNDGPVPDLPAGVDALPTRWRTERPERPITAYEQRGLDAGRTITDLVAIRTH